MCVGATTFFFSKPLYCQVIRIAYSEYPIFCILPSQHILPPMRTYPILQIMLASSSLKTSFTNAVFHQFVWASNNSLTVASLPKILTGDRAACALGVGSQGSSQIRIIDPSPTLHMSLFSSFFKFQILLHPYKGFRPRSASKNIPS